MSIYELFRKWNSDRLLNLKEISDGQWMIEGLIVWLNGTDRNIQFVCDINGGGCVREFVRISKFSGKDYIENKIIAEFIKDEKGQTLPSVVRSFFPLDKLMNITTYSEIEINPPVQDNMFQVKIPEGIRIID